MVWDEGAKEWRPRWGYKRANDNTKDWCIEVPSQAGKHRVLKDSPFTDWPLNAGLEIVTTFKMSEMKFHFTHFEGDYNFC